MMLAAAVLASAQGIGAPGVGKDSQPSVAEWSGFGASVSFVDDCDGDGVQDYFIGAPVEPVDQRTTTRGVVRLYSGKSGSLLRTHTGTDGLGYCVSGAGDIDRDGHADYMALAGRGVFVWSGKTGGLLLRPGFPMGSWGMLASAGDLNGDGFPDILIAGNECREGDWRGLVSAVSGKSGEKLFELAEVSRTHAWIDSIAGGSDLDEDECPDFLLGVPGRVSEGARGAVKVYSGASRRLLYTIAGAFPGDGFGSDVAFVRDLDGDGADDLIAAAPGTPPPIPAWMQRNAGYVRVHSGKDGGILFVLDSTNAEGPFHAERTRFGHDVADAGDVDRDGTHDIAVASWQCSLGGEPGVHLYSGRNGALLRRVDLKEEPGVVTANLGWCLVAGVDVDSDGVPDALLSDVGEDFGWPMWYGEVHVFSLGSGHRIRTVKAQ